MDADHREISAHFARLIEMVELDDVAQWIPRAVDLARVAEAHFDRERRIMVELAYSAQSEHDQAHQDFLRDARRAINAAQFDGRLSLEFLRWAMHLDSWFRTHVLSRDLPLADALARADPLK